MLYNGSNFYGYDADVVTATDYYPFGMTMPGRTFSSGSEYRYGFNGKEKDNSTGEGNLDFGARILDVRLGRWLSVDPLFHLYPSISPYTFVLNSPLITVDPNGEYPIIVITNDHDRFGFAHVYGENGTDIIQTVIVKTYKMIVYDVDANGKRTQIGPTFQVTRDGYYNHGPKAKVTIGKKGIFFKDKVKDTTPADLLINRTAEPLTDVSVSVQWVQGYGDKCSDLAIGAYDCEPLASNIIGDINKHTNGTSVGADVNRTEVADANGNKIGKPTSQLIHIGGVYTASEANTLAGAFGCFGVIDESQTYNTFGDAEKLLPEYKKVRTNGALPSGITTSNSTMKTLQSSIEQAQALAKARKEKDYKAIKVEIKKRASDQYKKQVKVETGVKTTEVIK